MVLRLARKFIEKHYGKLTLQSIRPLQGNDMAAIKKGDRAKIRNGQIIYYTFLSLSDTLYL